MAATDQVTEGQLDIVVAETQAGFVVTRGIRGLLTNLTTAVKTNIVAAINEVNAKITGANIKALYEGNSNTNSFTDAEQAKLASIDATHYLAPVQDRPALALLTEASLTDKARVYVEDEQTDYFYDSSATSGDVAPAGQTGSTGFWRPVAVGGETSASIKSKYESNPNTNAFTDADQAKLAAIVASTKDYTGAITA